MSDYVNVWQPPVLARLEELLQQPGSYAEIAAWLSKEFAMEFSKSATIAKATRCGLADKHRPSPARQKHKAKKVYRHPVAAPAPVKERPKIEPGKVTIYQLDYHTCRWPVTDGQPPYLYCGEEPLEGQSYCLAHCRKAYPAMGRH